MSDVKSMIEAGKTSLGIEFGSTRIKAVLVGEDNAPIASGSHEWENRLDNGVWTYTLEDIWTGLQDCYRDLAVDVKKQYDVELTTVGALGFSAMMHGYMVFDKAGEQLVPFRTWRNTMTEQAAKELTELFRFNMPQRWSGAHLYQAILNKEEHVKDIDFITTLAGYVHWKLTGEKVLGVGDASGMFPIDSTTRNWNKEMLAKFDELVAPKGYPWKVEDILPKVLVAGEKAGTLTEEGAKLLDPTGKLQAGIPVCPPEGDADCGGLMSYNFFAGEPVVGFDEGRPLFVRMPDSKFNLANFMRANLYASLEVLKVGMDILLKEEKVVVDEILGHGGLFKTKGVGQSILAAALDTPVSVMETAGEGGAWGIALLASYMNNKAEDEALDDYLDAKVFAGQKGTKMDPDPKDVEGYNTFIERFKKTLPIMKAATETMK